jgi:hypothetical protein
MNVMVKRTHMIHHVLSVREPHNETDERAYYLMIDVTRGVWYWEHEIAEYRK